MSRLKTHLIQEPSINCSGSNIIESKIPLLKENHYYVENVPLDGDAPKQLIRAYFFERDSTVRKRALDSWPAYIAKTAAKWYPIESITEYMINRIGKVLGVNINSVALVKANGQIRFLSRYFLKENERLVHGAEICGGYLNDADLAREIANNRETSREFFTFEFISKAIHAVYPHCCEMLINELVKMIAFDAIVGNNDRHFYNWGVIDGLKKSRKIAKFAPLFDSARGLLWNTSDKNVVKHLRDSSTGGKKVVNYVQKAYPRISIEENKQANHFELVRFLKDENFEYKKIICELASTKRETEVLNMLRKEFYPIILRERSQLLEMILQMRFKIIREVCYA